jgi:hypothetical protein
MNDSTPNQRTRQTRLKRFHIIRDGQELFILACGLTPEECEELAVRRRSPKARRQFTTRLRAARRAEDKPLKDAIRRMQGGVR